MTCIVSLIDKGTIFMGGDAAAGDPATYFSAPTKNSKVFVRGPYIFGYTGSFRMGHLLQYAGDLPAPPSDTYALHGFLVTTFVDVVRKLFEKYGALRVQDKVDKTEEFLIGVKGRVFYIGWDFQVTEYRGPYHAVGCGMQLALGAMYSTPEAEPEDRIANALSAAAEFDAYVRKPFTIAELRAGAK